MDFGKDTLAKIFCREEEGGVDFYLKCIFVKSQEIEAKNIYDSLSDVGEIRVYQRADFQSGSRVLKKVF